MLSKYYFLPLALVLLLPFAFFPPQEAFGVAFSIDCDGTIQTSASIVAITACDVGTGLTDAILIIGVFGDDGGGTHGAPTVTRGTGTICGTGTETATLIGTELTNGDSIISMWRLLDSEFTEGSADVCVTWASSDPPDEWSAHISVYVNVDQSTPIPANGSGQCSGTTDCTATVTVATSEIGVYGLQCVDNANLTTPNAGDTNRFALVTGGGDRNASFINTDPTVASPSTLGIDLLSKACATGQMKTIALGDEPSGDVNDDQFMNSGCCLFFINPMIDFVDFWSTMILNSLISWQVLTIS